MQVNLVSPNQYESLVDLLCELHTYYNNGSDVSKDLVKKHLLNNLMSEESPTEIVVVENSSGKVIGLAAISFVYSIVEYEKSKSMQCQLKELYVSNTERNNGVGYELMSWVVKYAEEKGCCRIDWPVKLANLRGQNFYQKFGGKPVEDRLSYRLSLPRNFSN